MDKKERFEEIYDALEKHDFSALERRRKAACKTGVSSKAMGCLATLALPAFGICLVLLLLNGGISKANPYMNYIIPVMILAVILIILRFIQVKTRNNREKQYRRHYSSEFNNIFLKLIEPNYSYDDKRGISEKSYKLIQLSSYDQYASNGLISGYLDDGYPFLAGQVTTKSTYEDYNENRVTHTDFDGILYEIKLPFNIYSKLYLRSDKNVDNAGFFRKLLNPDVLLSNLKVQLASEEFESVFDVYAEDKFLAIRLFTPDAMHDLVKLYTSSSGKFEATIQNDTLYIRFATGELFRAPEDLDVSVLDKDILYRYYKKFENTLEISRKFIEILEKSNA